MSSIPKAVLYYSPASSWSSVVLLTLVEKGYGKDEVDLKIVDLDKGENFSPGFLRLNSHATIPTLIVPLQKTLSEEVESRYKAVTNTKAIVELLDKSRSSLSRTHTTSDAPAPSLSPATVAFTATSNAIIESLHSTDPDKLAYLNVVDEASLRKTAELSLPSLTAKRDTLQKNLAEAESGTINVTAKVQNFWREKKADVEIFLEVFQAVVTGESSSDVEQKKKGFLATAQETWGTNVKKVIELVNKELIGPLAFGEQISVADLHIAGWLSTVALLAGASSDDDGATVVKKLEARITGLSLPKDYHFPAGGQLPQLPAKQAKLGAFWDALKTRLSWKQVYADGLH